MIFQPRVTFESALTALNIKYLVKIGTTNRSQIFTKEQQKYVFCRSGLMSVSIYRAVEPPLCNSACASTVYLQRCVAIRHMIPINLLHRRALCHKESSLCIYRAYFCCGCIHNGMTYKMHNVVYCYVWESSTI